IPLMRKNKRKVYVFRFGRTFVAVGVYSSPTARRYPRKQSLPLGKRGSNFTVLRLPSVGKFNSFSPQYDGAIIFGLIKNEPSMVTATHIFTIQGYLAQGYTPSEIDKSLYFNSPQLSEDDVYFSLIQYYRYAYYLDGGEKQKAVESILRLEDCLEYLPTEYLLPICSEITFTYCRLQEDKEAAECYYAFVQELKENEGTLDTLRSEFAYATLCGNEKEKEEILLRLEYALEQEPLAGVRKYEKKLLKELYGV
ncbi:MAG: hypothetical protein IJY26_01850, partial [Clostridia bacterium]|nr:hypothetical protein [Clostridia bacterium]